MINLFVDYACNLDCDYCFVRGLSTEHPPMLGAKDFERFCSWARKVHLPSLGILGGEPTLHPDIVEMLERLMDAGVAPVLFTNALFPRPIHKQLAALTFNIVVNYNDPMNLSGQQWALMQDNIAGLKEAGAHLSFSKNFSKGAMEFEYLIEGCRAFDIKRVRYDVSRPSSLARNEYFDFSETKELVPDIMRFVKACEAEGIVTGLDCCMPPCAFDPESLEYLQTHSMKFSGVCFPSLDVQTDLSVTHCIPLQCVQAPDITTFGGEWDLLDYFCGAVKDLRGRPCFPGCAECGDFGVSCQGGCMALKREIDVT